MLMPVAVLTHMLMFGLALSGAPANTNKNKCHFVSEWKLHDESPDASPPYLPQTLSLRRVCDDKAPIPSSSRV